LIFFLNVYYIYELHHCHGSVDQHESRVDTCASVVFLWVCGLCLTAAATSLLLGVSENLICPTAVVQPAGIGVGGGGSTAIEGVDEIGSKFSSLFDVLSLPAVHGLILYLFTMEVRLHGAIDLMMID